MAAIRQLIPLALCTLLLPTAAARAQVFVVTQEQVAGRYLQFEPTHVALPKMHAGPFTLEALERSLASEQGAAMRPLPLASRGLTLVANGPLEPAGLQYVQELDQKGVSSRPSERVTITKITFRRDRIIFEFNGGPDMPHKYLRHIQLGTGMADMPLARENGAQAIGSRLALVFPGGVPNVTGDEVKQLIAPIVGFGEKSPQEAYVATLPPFLKKAILDAHVLVGMNQDMVLHAVGQPQHKSREQEAGGLQFQVWSYGGPPDKTQFVRFEGNRVTQVEDAEIGKPPVLRAANEMGNYWETQAGLTENERLIKLGDQSEADRVAQNAAPGPAPTLRKPGETLPSDNNPQTPTMKPVQFPTGAAKPAQ